MDGSGNYCSRCGQKLHIHLNPTLHDLVHDGVHEFLHLDGKIFKTLIVLFQKPGLLTLDFLEGKRVTYINPIRLYLTMSILYFVLSALSFGSISFFKVHTDDTEKKVAVTKVSDPDLAESTLNLETGNVWLDAQFKSWGPTFKKGIERLQKDDKEFKKIYTGSIAKSLFLLMPLFGFIVMVSYGLRRLRYPQYLYFSLNYHAALFAGLLLTIPLGYFYDGIILVWMVWAWAYLALSLKRIWKGSSARAFVRASLTLSVYGMLFAITLALTGMYAIYQVGLHA